ncbi:MAG TPA: TatD family hydrolase [Dehalococcoidia bacterium]|nr:TatD family hydrolase [Dehalococcoidia bacterium]
MLHLIDTHAHLDEIEVLDEQIIEAKEAGLVAIIAVGSDLSSNQRVLEIANLHLGFIFPALGWHPWYIKEDGIDANLEFIAANIDKVVGVGEIGLDYHKRVRVASSKDLQKTVLDELCKLAAAHDKPVLIHSRYAWRDAYDAVYHAGLEKAVFHWYTGTSSVLRDIIEHGYYISVTPAVEYHEEHRRAVKEAPLSQLLLETDSPVTYGRGSDHEFVASPAYVRRSLKITAELKGLSEAELAAATTKNAERLFGIV